MLNEEFFQVGSKYDDAINEARKYIAKLEEIVKIMKKNGA